MAELTQSRLKELLNYNPDTGVFTWAVRAAKRVKVGGVAGCLSAAGYRRIKIDGKRYPAHRLAWFYMTGERPKDEIDHINGVPADNRWSNLREATRAGNCQNLKLLSTNTSGFMGVSWHMASQKWQAHISIAGRKKFLGCFATPEAAHAAYLAAKADLHTFQPIPRCAGGATNERQRQYG